jgi:PAS domain S-box-containing protein
MTRQSIEPLKKNSSRDEELKAKELEVQGLNDEVQRLRAFTESLIQSIGSALILVDTKEQITYFNRAAEKVLGYSRKEVIGKPFAIFSLREKKQTMPTHFMSHGEMDSRREGLIRRKDKVEIPVGFNITDHLDSHGKKIGKIISFRDMTNVPLLRNSPRDPKSLGRDKDHGPGAGRGDGARRPQEGVSQSDYQGDRSTKRPVENLLLLRQASEIEPGGM